MSAGALIRNAQVLMSIHDLELLKLNTSERAKRRSAAAATP
jgi:hypothetical protein